MPTDDFINVSLNFPHKIDKWSKNISADKQNGLMTILIMKAGVKEVVGLACIFLEGTILPSILVVKTLLCW